MKLTKNDIDLLLELAKKAALKTGQYIQKYDRTKLGVLLKKGGSSEASQVVTEVDFYCQELILEVLLPSIKAYDFGVLTEELEDDKSRFEKDYFWCIDPLDGTLPFIENRDGYSVSIALVSRAGEAKIGVIFDPYNDVLYEAVNGKGALRNGNVLEVVTRVGNDSFTFVSDRSLMSHARIDEVKLKLSALASMYQLNTLKIIEHGGAALNAMWVIENAPSCYFKFPKQELGGGSLWDYAASSCIVKEAGGFAFNFSKQPIDLNSPESTFMNNEGVFYASAKNIVEDLIL